MMSLYLKLLHSLERLLSLLLCEELERELVLADLLFRIYVPADLKSLHLPFPACNQPGRCCTIEVGATWQWCPAGLWPLLN